MVRAAAVAAILVAAVAPARAAEPREQAAALVEEGLGLARGGDFAQAAERFEAAFKLFPHPEIAHNMARAQEELGQLAAAWTWFRKALEMDAAYTFAEDARERVTNLEKALRKTHARVKITSVPQAVEVSLLADGRPLGTFPATPVDLWVPAGTLTVEGRKGGFETTSLVREVAAGPDVALEIVLTPERRKGFLSVAANVTGASVRLNGERAGETPLAARPFAVGTYVVRVEKEGYAPVEKTVVVEPDRETPVVVSLTRLGGAPDPPPAGGEERAGRGARGRVGIGLLAGAGALAGGGAALHVVAFDRARQARDVPNDPNDPDNAENDREYRRLKDDALGFQTFAFVGYGLAAAAAVTGVVLLVTDPGAPATRATAAPVSGARWTPAVAPLRGGASLGAVVRF